MLKKIILALALVILNSGMAIAAERTLIVAHDATWPPMEYIDSDKNIVGYTVDYIDAIAKETGVKVEHKNVAWAGIFGELAANRCDVIASSVTITLERQKVMSFSMPYYTVQQAVVVAKNSTFTSAADLKDKRLGAQISTTGYFAADKIIGNKTKSYDAIGHAIEDLKNGRLDAVLCDDPVAADFALQNADNKNLLKIAFVITDAEVEHYGFAVRPDDKEALDILNKGIQAVKEKGIEAELIKKWIGK
ncbi:MAG: basic amino acid ABC transporter substrate-binding protein [Deltaproteobacteria bacterium]|jgi:polar amino acid transport system substrate-binding protein|nr:basic amino acid ABC transporter substrate-binding protein [Deltaproteobacteria bacterium]